MAVPIFIFFVILGTVVTVHELGHFLFARRAGIFVKEFALGMGPKLLVFRGKKKTEHPVEGEEDVTLYTLRLFPIGGFCSVRGQDSDVPGDAEAMGNKSIWQRFWFITGGSIFNFAAALVLFFVLSLLTGYSIQQIRAVEAGAPAYNAGMIVGDRITHVNGSSVRLWENFRFMMDMSGGQPMDFRVVRDGQRMELVVTPELGQAGVYRIGVNMTPRIGLLSNVDGDFARASLWGSFVNSVDMIGFNIRMPFRILARVITSQPVPESGELRPIGPIGIAAIVSDVYQDTVQRGFVETLLPMLFLTAIINVALGVMNLLPIPALDGARLMFLLIEAVRRKPVSPEREGMVHFVGFVILIALGIFIAYRDIANLL